MHSVVEFAYPVMVALGVKGCMYVVPGIVGTSRPLWTDMIIAVCWHRQGGFALDFPQGRISYAGELNGNPGKTSLAVIQTFRKLPEEVRRKSFEQIERMYEDIPEGFVPREYMPVTWDELRSLDPGILEVGNHTLSHPKLVNVDHATMQAEISGARRMIADELGTPVDHFCYPGGSYDREVVECVRSAGHASATTGVFGRNTRETPALELRRVVISPTLARFQSRMSGFERLVRTAMKPGRLFWTFLIVLGLQAEILAACAA
jgi:peptidoglycan/xylan/chitin deacetylase (PgdA/CDA1 family)